MPLYTLFKLNGTEMRKEGSFFFKTAAFSVKAPPAP